MGLIIDNEPDLFVLAKNNIILAGSVDTTDLVVTAGTQGYAEYKFTEAQGGMENGATFDIVFSNFNGSGASKTIHFFIKDNPADMYDIKSFSAYNKPFKVWVLYLIEEVFKVPYISDNYFALVNTSVPTEYKFAIQANQKGSQWNLVINSAFFIPANYVQGNSAAADTLDNLYMQCHVYQKRFTETDSGTRNADVKLFTLKSFLDANLKFAFSLNTDIKKYLLPYLFRAEDSLHIGTDIFRFILELKYRNNLLDETGVMPATAAQYLYQSTFVAILGGRAWYDSIGKDINLDYYSDFNRKFLTRRPKIVYLGECICINDFIINDDNVDINAMFCTVQYTFADGQIFVDDIQNVKKMNNKLGCVVFNYNDALFDAQFNGQRLVSLKYQVRNLDRKTTTSVGQLTGKDSEVREIIFNRKVHRHNNYFRFHGSLAGSEFAWLTGKIEAEVEAAGVDYEKDLSYAKTLYGDEATIWKEFQFGRDDIRYNQKFKINTGYKSKEEIQWLQELIGSELIFWYTKPQMDAFVNSQNSLPHDQDDLSYQVVVIDKSTVKYHDGNEELQAMSFEFKIAVESVAPHFTIKDSLQPTAISLDIFVIDVRAATLYNVSLNPQVIIRIKSGYQIGDTITIEHPSLAEPIVSTIVEDGEPYVDDTPESDNIRMNGDIHAITLQLKHVIDKYDISNLGPLNSTDYIYLSNRAVPLSDIINLKVTSTIAAIEYVNCDNIWKYILDGSALGKVLDYDFANGTHNIYLWDILTYNVHGTSTFYEIKLPATLEDWVYCIADYFAIPCPEFIVADIDENGYVRVKVDPDGPLAAANSLRQLIGGMDKYIFISKQFD